LAVFNKVIFQAILAKWRVHGVLGTVSGFGT